MAAPLQKQATPLNFIRGIDTKTDKKQVEFGKFLDLQNSIFDVEGQLTKRNGFEMLKPLPVTDSTFLTTFNGNLTAIGNELYAYSEGTNTWSNKGSTQPLDLHTLSLVKGATAQSQADIARAPNGLVCVVYTDQVPSMGGLVPTPKYAVLDSSTGQNIVPPTNLAVSPAVGLASPKVFLLGNYFLVVFSASVTGSPRLQYIAISIADPTIVSAPVNLSTTYEPNDRVAWDGVVANNNLYIVYNGSDPGGAIRYTGLNSTLIQQTTVVIPGHLASTVTVCADTSTPIPTMYAAFHDNTATTGSGWAFGFNPQLQQVMAPQQIIGTDQYTLANLASAVTNNMLHIYYEVLNTYNFPEFNLTDYVERVSIDLTSTASLINQSITYTSVDPGAIGSQITIELTNPGAPSSPLSISVIDRAIEVSLATNGSSVITTTRAQLVAALQANSSVTALISIAGSGATLVTAVGPLNLEMDLSPQSVVVRSVGLASKLFVWGGMIHFLSAYQSAYQSSYFLINEDGEVVSKLAYSNGQGYSHTGIPSAVVDGDDIYIPYIYKTRIQPVNKNVFSPELQSSPGIYSQTGVNLATFTFGVHDVVPVEIGNDLNLTGGFVWSYDGVEPVEAGFHLFPDDVWGDTGGDYGAMAPQKYFYVAVYEWGDNQGNIFRSAPSIPVEVDLSNYVQTVTFDAEFTSFDTVLEVSDTTNLYVGQILTDTTTPGNFAAGTYIVSINTADSEITINTPTLGSSAGSPGDSIETETALDVQLYVPTLRLTYKIDNPVRITIYRWSEAQQTYYMVTSITDPTLNNTNVDEVVFTDKQADSSILGNSILYTTGGVVENIAAPASPIMTVLKNRLFILNAENRNEWWYSKPILPGEPVEMSDLFTVFVNPTLTGQGSTGVCTAGAGMDDKIIFFKRNAIYYMTGNGPDAVGNNNDYSEPVAVNSTVGCTNQRSIVFIPQGLMFQSDKGIWLLGRDLSTKYIGAPVEGYNNETVLSAINIPGTNQVRFTMSGGKTLMYDYYYDQWGTFTNIPALASTLYQDLHTFVNSRGELFQETPGKYVDGSAPVLMSFTTNWVKLTGLQGYQRFYYFYMLGTYLSQHRLSMEIAYDYNNTPLQQEIITPDNVSSNWGDEALWGSSETWGGSDNVEQWRIHAIKQTCQAFKIHCRELINTDDISPNNKAGLTVSGLNMIIGVKKSRPNIPAKHSI